MSWLNINGNWIGRNRGGQKWSSYWNPQTDEHKTLMDAVTVKPSLTVQHAQNDFIYYLKGNNSDSRDVWAKLACIIPYFARMTNSVDALKWWNNPARTASLGGANPPTYTAGQGFTGTANGYIDTGFNPSVDGSTLYTQNDCSNGWYFYNNRTTGADKGNGLVSSATNNPGIQLYPKYPDNNLYYRQQGLYASIPGGASTQNMFTAVRLSATQQQMYLNRTGAGLHNANSTALANETVNDLCQKTIGGSRTSFSDDTIALRFFASGLDATDIKVICDALDTLMMSLSNDVLMSDACDGTSIDTDKWDVANSSTNVATFEQNNALIMNSLSLASTAVNEYYLNMISAKTGAGWGVWRFSIASILRKSNAGYVKIGIVNNKAADGYLIGFTNDAPENISFVIKNAHYAAAYSVSNAFEFFAEIKIVVTPTGKVKAYKWVNDAWTQIGVDQYLKQGVFYLSMATRGVTLMKSSIRDVYVTNYDYSTLIP